MSFLPYYCATTCRAQNLDDRMGCLYSTHVFFDYYSLLLDRFIDQRRLPCMQHVWHEIWLVIACLFLIPRCLRHLAVACCANCCTLSSKSSFRKEYLV